MFSQLRLATFYVGEIVFSEGDLGVQVYFLSKGEVELQTKKTETFMDLKNDGIFGEVSVVCACLRPYSVVCKTVCHVAFIAKEQVSDICETFPQLKEALLRSASRKMVIIERAVSERVMSAMDLDGDGKVTAEEYAEARGVSMDEAKEAIAKYDADGDGMLDPKELDSRPSVEEEGPEDLEIWEEATMLMKDHCLIHPRVPPKMIWDLVLAFLIVYSVVFVPYRLGFFGGAEPTEGFQVFDIVADVFFGLDILTAFRTAFPDPLTGALVTSNFAVTCNYLKGWFTIDFASTIPVDRIANLGGSTSANQQARLRAFKTLRVLRLFRLLKLLRLFKLKRLMGSYASKFYGPSAVGGV